MITRPIMTALALTGALAVACGDPPRDPTGVAPSFHRDGEGRTVHWLSAWTTSHGSRQTTPAMSGRTVRMILRPTISGNQLRVKLENTMGEAPVVFSGAYIGVAGSGAAVVPGSNKRLTFDEHDGLTLGPGEGAYSDPVHFHVEAFEKLALSLDVVSASDISAHVVGLTINYSASGARAEDPSGDGYAPLPEIPALNSGQWPFYWVAALDVHSSEASGTIVLFGNSITDGRCSTRDANGMVQPDLYQRWGDVLSERLAELPKKDRKAVANEGIAGNRILNRGNGPSALERVDRDVLDRSGATHVVFFEGTNDISGGFTAAEVIAGTQEIIDRVHAKGLKIIGVTVIPRGRTGAGWSATQEQHRLAVNAWMRTQANFDGLIDFDALMQGPIIPETGAVQIRAEFNCDNTHPNAAGYKAMGEAIDLSLFKGDDDDDDDQRRLECFDANATPVTFGANWPLTDASGNPSVNAPTLDQVELARFEINNSCGVRVGARKVGSPLAVLVRDNQSTNAARSSAVTHELIDAGAVAVVGGGASVTAPPAAQVAVEANVPFGANQAAADAMSGCTVAELADPAVIKSATPVYGAGRCWNNRGLVFRTRDTGYRLGGLGATYARQTYPTLTTAAIVYRDDDARPTGDGLRDRFVELGGAVLAEGGHTIVGTGTTVAAFKTLLRTVTAGNPSIILGSTNSIHLRRFIQAYVELRDDPTWTEKPANFNTLKFVWSATLADNYSDVGATALAVLVNQSEFTTSAWDPNSTAFQRWFALYRSYNPNAQPPTSSFYMAAYDAVIVMALAVTAAGTTDGPAVAAKLREVANPPGRVVCPGQWRKAFRLLARGKDINYEGALGPVDLDERGNATGFVLGLFKVRSDGSTALVSTFGAGPQPTCEDDRTGDEDDDEGDGEGDA